MNKLKVMTVLGTRPEIIRLSRIISLLDKHCNHTVVHTGQNYDYELNEIFFNELEIRKPDVYLNAAGETPSQSIGQIIIATDKVFAEFKPEALLILGDTNSCLCAISAKRHKIPIFHMEAGNRCFDFKVPEEINRKIIDHIADINLTYSQIARDYLIREGILADRIIRTGSPMKEVLNYYKDKINKSDILKKIDLVSEDYFLVSSHREENVDLKSNLTNFINLLNHLASSYNKRVIVSTHPRTRKKIDELNLEIDSLISFFKPFGFIDYINLQMNAKCVLSDSGTITEESSILNFPALNLRDVHERPEGFEEGSVMFVGMNLERVTQGLEILNQQPRGPVRSLNIVEDYNSDNVSLKVLRIIQSYTNFVKTKVWL
jgi:UDP-N-acetylglucosamine 2-epimerase (non-hydrolysing)